MHSIIEALIGASSPRGVFNINPERRNEAEKLFSENKVLHDTPNWKVKQCDCGRHLGLFARNHDAECPKAWDLVATVFMHYTEALQPMHVTQLTERFVFDAKESMSFFFYAMARVNDNLRAAINDVRNELEDGALVDAVSLVEPVSSLADLMHAELIGFSHRGNAFGAFSVATTESGVQLDVLKSYVR